MSLCYGEIELEKEIDIEKDIDVDDRVKNIIKCYEDNISLITPASAELLFSYIDDMDQEVIIQAIKNASTQGVRNAKYINGILRSWKNKGYKHIADIANEQQQHQKQQQPSVSETEEEKLERRMKEIQEMRENGVK